MKPAQVSMPSDTQILIVRDFAAPRSLVFEAWAKAEPLRRWFACPQLELLSCDVDFREGGKWRVVTRDPSGAQHPLSGEYREIDRPARIVFTEVYEPFPGSDHIVTLTFEEKNGITTFKQLFQHRSKEARDGHLQSGMASGVEDTCQRMEALFPALAKSA